MFTEKKIIFVIVDNFATEVPKIKKSHLKSKDHFLFYRNCENVVTMIKHNMPGGNYVIFIFGIPDGYDELVKLTKRVNKKNKVFIYTEEKPFESKDIDGFIRKIHLDDDLPYLISLI